MRSQWGRDEICPDSIDDFPIFYRLAHQTSQNHTKPMGFTSWRYQINGHPADSWNTRAASPSRCSTCAESRSPRCQWIDFKGKRTLKRWKKPLVIQRSYWKLPFTVESIIWWFSIAMLNYQRVFHGKTHCSFNRFSLKPIYADNCTENSGGPKRRPNQVSRMCPLLFILESCENPLVYMVLPNWRKITEAYIESSGTNLG